MSPVYIYPGTFSPPTEGHYHILGKALDIADEVIIICSVNPDKQDNWFTPEECKKLWERYELEEWDDEYSRKRRVKVETLKSFTAYMQKENIDPAAIVMIRGIRGKEDLEEEKKVVLLNKKQFRIENFLYIFCDDKFKEISSTKVRELIAKGKFKQAREWLAWDVFDSLLERFEEKGGKEDDRPVCKSSSRAPGRRLPAAK